MENTRPPVLSRFPVTVVGILWDPLQLIFMALPLLLIIISVVKSKAWLFPRAPDIWPTAIM